MHATSYNFCMLSKIFEFTHDLLAITRSIFRQNNFKLPMMGRIEAMFLVYVMIENGTWSHASAKHFMKVFLVLSTLAFHRQNSTPALDGQSKHIQFIAANCCYVFSSHLEFTSTTCSNQSFSIHELLIYMIVFALYLFAETIA